MPEQFRSVIFMFMLVLAALTACVEHSNDAIHGLELKVDNKQALKYLNEEASDHPKNPEVFYQLSRVLFDEVNYSFALQNINKATALQQDNPEYYFMEGKIYQKLNEPQKAIEAMQLAEGLGKKSQELYKIVAEEYLRLGEAAKARAAVDRITGTNKSAEAYSLKGDIMLSMGDTAIAVENYGRALALDSSFIRPYIALADVNMARENEDEAFGFVGKLLRFEPDNIEFLEREGNLLQRTGQLDSAKQIFQDIAGKRGNYLDFYKLSNIYYQLRQYDSVKIMAEKAFELNEKFLEAQIMVARSLDKSRQYQQAIDVYEMILETDSTNNLALTELDNLKRKVAYLWRLEQQRRALDSVKNNPPPAVQKKEIEN